MSGWKIQTARVTLFPLLASGSAPRSALELYKAVWSKDPDSFQNAPTGTAPFPTSVAQGNVDGIALSCQTQPIRLDFAFTPVGSPGVSFPWIDDTVLLASKMKELLASASKASHDVPLNRVAVYLQLGQETTGYSEANGLISDAIWSDRPIKLADEQDFILQLNPVRQDTRDRELRLNFITKWAVDRIQLITFFGGQMPGVGQGMSGGPLVVERIVPSITFDNSNVPLQRSFAPDDIKKVLFDLFNEFTAQLKRCSISLEGF